MPILLFADSWCVDQNACAMYGKEHCETYDWINLNCPKLCGHCGNGECNFLPKTHFTSDNKFIFFLSECLTLAGALVAISYTSLPSSW